MTNLEYELSLLAASVWVSENCGIDTDPRELGRRVAQIALGVAEALGPLRQTETSYHYAGETSTGNSPKAGTDALPPLAVLQGDSELAAGAEALAATEQQDALLLADIEARLADEVRGLGLALTEFALRTKAIREEIPNSAQFCKLIAGFFPMVAFQVADALLRSCKGFSFEDDGAVYLKQLGLEVDDFVREVDLEGRKFLAVAFLDKGGSNVLDRCAQGDEL